MRLDRREPGFGGTSPALADQDAAARDVREDGTKRLLTNSRGDPRVDGTL
jgi:hypothetical protein